MYANGMEISGKASPHKVLASTPDVCMSPPAPPAGPVPVPYPNFAQSSDLTDGSKNVFIGGKPICLKGKSSYKKSTGDEACTKNFGAGIMSHTNTGAVKHKAGSFDVKIEGYGVCRTLDLTTGNHSNPGNGCMAPDNAGVYVSVEKTETCKELEQANKDGREELAEKTQNQKVVGTDGKGCGTTVSSMKYQGNKGGRPFVRSAHNNQKAHEFCPDRFTSGGLMSNRKQGISEIKNYTHGTPYDQMSGHAEARLLDALGALKKGDIPPGKVTFNIDWKPRDLQEDPSKMPCEVCHKMMCSMDSNVRVYVCGADRKEREVPCPVSPQNRKNLRKSLGELPL